MTHIISHLSQHIGQIIASSLYVTPPHVSNMVMNSSNVSL